MQIFIRRNAICLLLLVAFDGKLFASNECGGTFDSPAPSLPAADSVVSLSAEQKPDETVEEEWMGYVDALDGDTAYVILEAPNGDKYEGQYPVQELTALGIREKRRFKCRTVWRNGRVEVELEAIPDIIVTEEEEAEIHKRIDELLSGGLFDGDG